MRNLALFATTVLAASLAHAAGSAGTWTTMIYTPYSASADGSVVVGDDASVDNIWRWTSGTGTQYIGGVSSLNTGVGEVFVSANGSTIVGGSLDANGVRNTSVYQAATGTWLSLGGLGGYSYSGGLSTYANNTANYNSTGSAWGMSTNGTFVVGQSYQSGNGSNNSRATVWNTVTGTITNLGNNPGITVGPNQRTRANGVSDDGKVVGGFGANSTPLVWTENADGKTYSAIQVAAVTGTTLNAVNAVSADGQWVAGAGYIGTSNGSAYRFNPGTSQLQMLGKLNANSGGNDAAMAMSADGSTIVGYENDNSGDPIERAGFIWTASSGIESLDTFLAGYGIDTSNTFNFSTPLGMSSNSTSLTIVGFGNANGSGVRTGFEVTVPLTAAVPEASTYAMMLAGLGAIGFVARRRRSGRTAG